MPILVNFYARFWVLSTELQSPTLFPNFLRFLLPLLLLQLRSSSYASNSPIQSSNLIILNFCVFCLFMNNFFVSSLPLLKLLIIFIYCWLHTWFCSLLSLDPKQERGAFLCLAINGTGMSSILVSAFNEKKNFLHLNPVRPMRYVKSFEKLAVCVLILF